MSASSTISSRETRGYFLLFLLFSAINLFGPAFIDLLFPPDIPEINIEEIQSPPSVAVDTAEEQLILTDFDINAVSEDELIAMGVSQQAAATWIKFRDALDGFEEVGQIKEIYGLSPRTIERLVPHATVGGPTARKQTNHASNANKEQSRTEQARDKFIPPDRPDSSSSMPASVEPMEPIKLNTATARDLIKLRGIGPVFSERIIAFRDALGGFHSVEQIAETYGLPPETYESIRNKLIISKNWDKFDINSAKAEVLAKHPYISWDMAGMIVRYREQNGAYKSIQDLNRLHGITKEELDRAIPYLEAIQSKEDIVINPAGD